MNRLGFSKIRLTWVAPSGQLHPSANHLEGFFEALFRTITYLVARTRRRSEHQGHSLPRGCHPVNHSIWVGLVLTARRTAMCSKFPIYLRGIWA